MVVSLWELTVAKMIRNPSRPFLGREGGCKKKGLDNPSDCCESNLAQTLFLTVNECGGKGLIPDAICAKYNILQY